MSTRATLSSEGSAGEGPVSELISVFVDRIQFLVGCWIGGLYSCWLGDALSFWPHGPLLRAAHNVALGFC